MATKTFKIGEYCKGGVITVETKGKVVTVIGKDWDVSAGTTKSSNQSKAKEFTRLEVNLEFNTRAESSIDDFLHDLTTAYYANQIMEWIKTKVKFFERYCW
jgi:hypothetical protein